MENQLKQARLAAQQVGATLHTHKSGGAILGGHDPVKTDQISAVNNVNSTGLPLS